ncbi:aspartate-semialdehyde dehydrogenase [Candidatus Woesearchaeota archaeon]|nr:aspartate-semialdehyde dehydrogenase [Candidatus Woesearchaeota archaeon]
MKKLKVGILGATGMVGQQYLSLLEHHPWFEVVFLAASEQSAGKSYAEAVKGRWHMQKNIPVDASDLIVSRIDDLAHAMQCSFVFSALDTDTAKLWEERYAAAGIPVVSNASAHRKTDDVPMLIPEINPYHLGIIPEQQKRRGWKKGFIVVKSNCSLQSYLTPLYAIHRHAPLTKVMITTLQAVSGAGHPGVASFDILDNVVPFIRGEEEKSEQEPLKILGTLQNGTIKPAIGITFAAHCNRVPVLDGHIACVSFSCEKKLSSDVIKKLWNEFVALPQQLQLPSAPKHPIIYRPEEDRPQPRLDRDAEGGMAISVGRLRQCNLLDFRFVGLSHNTIRGAAGGGILNAELLYKQGYFL